MGNSYRRILLLGGVSLAAIGAPSIANAAPNVAPGFSQVDSSDPVEDLLIICNIGDSCDSGVEADGSGVISAIINGAASGRYEQIGRSPGGDVDLQMENHGEARIAAQASAEALAGGAQATAVIFDAIYQSGSAVGNVVLDLVNEGDLLVGALAVANGESGSGHATASVGYAVHQFANSTDEGASLAFANEGVLQVEANATATGHGAAATTSDIPVSASARARGARQVGVAGHGDVSLSADNAGTITVSADALAQGDETAFAQAFASSAIAQVAAAPAAVQTMANSGSLAAVANAAASASWADARATAFGAIAQSATASTADQHVVNSGSVSVEAEALAHGDSAAFGLALARGGIVQSAAATLLSQSVVNDGTIEIRATATATAESGFGRAIATAADGMMQFGAASSADQMMINSGTISLVANAGATGAGVALAGAHPVAAMDQQAWALNAVQAMANEGMVVVSANASAVANGTAVPTFDGEIDLGYASATAIAAGLFQGANGENAEQTLSNSGMIEVNVEAGAVGPADPNATGTAAAGIAVAYAIGDGAIQSNNATGSAVAAFTNSGTIEVHAAANGVAEAASATAVARGDYIVAKAGAPLTVDVENSGIINATATAVGAGTKAGRGYALARGVQVDNRAYVTGFVANPVDGSIMNSGEINVVANAAGNPFITSIGTGTGTGGATVTLGGSSAFGSGVLVMGGANNMTITNSGSINVDAVVADGRTAIAMGIGAIANGPAETDEADVLTINNAGEIVVRESVDGGATWRRGSAIHVAGNPDNYIAGVPNRTVVNLLSGHIYGNIEINSGDEINVSDGTTYFDGVITPRAMPAGGVTSAIFDTGRSGDGALTIDAGGNLILADPRATGDPAMYDGPAYAFVDSLTVGAGGTLTFELQPGAGGNQPVASYPQIFADTATLTGALAADVRPAGGIFDNSYFWDNVIDAEARNGEFDQCVMTEPYRSSPLLDFNCIHDGGENVDLQLNRIAFDAVTGLTLNQSSTAFALERLYNDVGAAGLIETPTGGVIADLFLADAGDYASALDQISGAPYAGYLQSIALLGYHYDSMLDRATDCEVPVLAASALECRTGPTHLWAQIDYQWRKQDGDLELAGSDHRRWSGLLGFDVNVAPAALLGASVGAVRNRTRFHDIGGSEVRANGWQAGLYGTYDPGPFYVKAMTTYSDFSGKSRRFIDFRSFGGATNGEINGRPDAKMWTVGLRAGYRIPIGVNSVVTPFIRYDYSHANLRSFTEHGTTGAELSVNGGKQDQSWLTGGIKWAGKLGDLVPELKVGYRQMFGDRRADFNANFPNIEGVDFDIVSASAKRSSVTAALSLGGKLGPADLRIGYEGAYDSGATEHGGYLKIVIPLGTAAAPPPLVPPPGAAAGLGRRLGTAD